MLSKLLNLLRIRIGAVALVALGALTLFPLIRNSKSVGTLNAKKLSWSKLTFALVGRVVMKGPQGLSLNAYSIPLSSDINGFEGCLYDAAYKEVWWKSYVPKPRFNPKKPNAVGLTRKGLLIAYFVETMSRQGFLAQSHHVYSLLQESRSKGLRHIGLLGHLDIAALVDRWNRQTKQYFDQQIWFNPDDISGFRDELSDILAESNSMLIRELYEKSRSLFPASEVVEYIYAEYLRNTGHHEQALRHFQRALAFNPRHEVSEIAYGNLAALLDDRDATDKSIVHYRLRDAEAVCRQNGWRYERLSEPRELTYEWDMWLRGKRRTGSHRIAFGPEYLMQFKEAEDTGSGVLACDTEDGKWLVKDTKHLDAVFFKLFSPSLITFNETQALVATKGGRSSKIRRERNAFAIPGTGWSYYHWLFEAVPLLQVYAEKGLAKGFPLYFPYCLRSWHMETLTLLGFDHVNILPYIPHRRTIFDEVLVPSFRSHNLIPSPSAIEYLRGALAQPKARKPGKFVYLTRKHIEGVRRLGNSGLLERTLLQKGFEAVDPSAMTIAEQIEYFSDVDVLVAEGGASNCNLVFCPDDVRAILIAADRAVYHTFTAVASSLGQKLMYVLGESRPTPNPYYLWTAYDHDTDVRAVSQVVDEVIGG